MSDPIDVVELARELARIASTTHDRETARLLLEVIERLLGAAGLPGGERMSD
jgi:hypothetical protein